MSTPTPRTGWRAVVHAVVLGLSTGLLLLVAALAVVLIVVPKATGSMPLTVLTQSMEPTLPPGTLLVVRPTPIDDIRVGDVVTYQIVSGQPAVVSHRVVSVSSSSNGERTFVLKGDNNAEADPAPVTAVQIRGVVWYSVPEIGNVNQVVNGSRSWLIPTVAGVLLTYGAVMMSAGFVSAARRRRARTSRARTSRGRRSAAHHIERTTTENRAETTTTTRSRLGGRDGRSAAGAGAPRRGGPTAPRRGRPGRSTRRVRAAEGRPRDPS
ncbi:signal peptidase I [Curtobacterium flaccumfaciens pv. flaccumfaciens]|uniref:signal peptidase I n=1 Tax=Curtobacterium flaccumfaciens TaxID=2035 RepID=UPI0026592620|nr:signal peptidase I [Curtobacterium flaccumfaciens]MCS5508425.1 signal peptidase I [Curtobacterium flaccumfaciens pv. flaccumfaciens]MCX2787833.1 signal peptidase I [Curtobacterium flaccumfaciens pv. flaccumfaciens]